MSFLSNWACLILFCKVVILWIVKVGVLMEVFNIMIDKMFLMVWMIFNWFGVRKNVERNCEMRILFWM